MPENGLNPSSDKLSSLAKSFDIMNYDLGLLAQPEVQAFTNVELPSGTVFKGAEEEPFTVLTTSAGDKIGFLRLPPLEQGEIMPDKNLVRKVSDMVKQYRKDVKVLIALSSWGWRGEREYIGQNPEYVPDLLLGSGEGTGVNGRLGANERCIWIRPYDKGRTVSEILLYAWPDRSKAHVWKEPDNFKTLTISLGDQYPSDPDVDAILK